MNRDYVLSGLILCCSVAAYAMEADSSSETVADTTQVAVSANSELANVVQPENTSWITRICGPSNSEERRECYRSCCGYSCAAVGAILVGGWFVCKIGWGNDCFLP